MIDFSLNADKKVVDELKANERQRNMKERATKVNYDFANRDNNVETSLPLERQVRKQHRLKTVAETETNENDTNRGEIRYERD